MIYLLLCLYVRSYLLHILFTNVLVFLFTWYVCMHHYYENILFAIKILLDLCFSNVL